MNDPDLPTGLSGLRWSPEGVATIGGEVLGLLRWLDRALGGWREGRVTAEIQSPPFISAGVLDRVGYLRAFPQLAGFPVTLPREPRVLAQFAEGHALGADGSLSIQPSLSIRMALSPAACYHAYPLYAGRALAAPHYASLCGTCFRSEEQYQPLRRQWAFTMRELVCLGTASAVAEFLHEGRAWLEDFAAQLNLPVVWRQASDPFFAPERSPGWLMQQIEPLKHELVFGNGVALASVNSHGAFFGSAFGISAEGKPAASGCIAAGIERWVYAVLKTHGSDPRSWPGNALEPAHA